MLEIDAQNLPVVRTRQALLLLDLQNDFISTGAILPVEAPSDFIENILKLVPEFRNLDSIIWIRSVFEASRAINEPQGECENVITDQELPMKARGGDWHLLGKPLGLPPQLRKAHERIAQANGRSLGHGPTLDSEINGEDLVVEETYLTIDEGQVPQVVLPNTPGAKFSQAVSKCVDTNRDMVFEKSTYSAFKDGKLVQRLRSKFVTGIYICGSLTNISVFATAMDAARHGYEITIVEDCLGYRSKARHDEALRKLIESTGCHVISSTDLITELRRKSLKQQAASRNFRKTPPEQNSGLEGLMARLNMRPDRHQAAVPRAIRAGTPVVAAAEPLMSLGYRAEAESPRIPFNIPQPEKRERVKAKLKTRRRESREEPREVVKGSDEDVALSPTSRTLRAASQALEEVTPSDKDSSTALTFDNLAPMTKNMPIKPHTNENGLLPIEAPHTQEKISVEPKLTPLCEGDTTIIPNLLDDNLAHDIFSKIRKEVLWQKMSHQGGDVPRLVAVQGLVAEDGSIPIYRHPADESPPLLPFSPAVSLIRTQVEQQLGHSVNHVLIQFYRDGTDHISEHSDKTLDIVPGTFISNVSLGAQRTMVFRTKKLPKTESTSNSETAPRQSCRAPLPHNSICKMGLATNMRWLHGIRQDKRMVSEKSEPELAFNGGRISLTFRSIGTYLDKDQCKIWGQGATSKTKEDARSVINGDAAKSEQMIRAFGKENHASEFDWAGHYGEGFDVLHISNSCKLFMSEDFVADMRVKLVLAEYGIPWSEGKVSSSFNWKADGSIQSPSIPNSQPVRFIDNDPSKSTVTGDLAILLYVDAVHSKSTGPNKSPSDIAKQYTRLQQCDVLLKKWYTRPFDLTYFYRELEKFEGYALEAEYIAGGEVSLADMALWPVLWEVNRDWTDFMGLPGVTQYYERMGGRQSVRRVVEEGELGSEKG